MVDDFSEMGWADYTAHLVGAGDLPKEHPTGGSMSRVVPVRLADEVVRRAVLSDAEIEIVQTAPPADQPVEVATRAENGRSEMARQLDDLGGIAATLRY